MNRRTFLRTLLASSALGAIPAGPAWAGHCHGAHETAAGTVGDRVRALASARPVSTDVRAIGSRLVKDAFLDQVALAYRNHSAAPLSVEGGGCDDGVTAIREGLAGFGCLCCPTEGSPARQFSYIPLARDIKVVAVHPDNPLESISSEDLKRLARGDIRDWQELGGPAGRIALVVHDHCPDYREPVREFLFDGDSGWAPEHIASPTDEDHLQQVIRFRRAIGINSWTIARRYVESGQLKLLALDQHPPTPAAAGAGDYRLTGPLGVIHPGAHSVPESAFLDFLFGPEGQQIIARQAVPVPRTSGAGHA